MDIVQEFEELKPILQEKWLDFYAKNKSLVFNYLSEHHGSKHGTTSYVKVECLLAILISLEPKLSITINNYIKICNYLKRQEPTIDNLLSILDITKDVSLLNKQVREKEEKIKNQFISPPSLLDEFRNKNV